MYIFIYIYTFLYSERVCNLGTSGGVELVAAASKEALDADELRDTLAILSTVIWNPQRTNNNNNKEFTMIKKNKPNQKSF